MRQEKINKNTEKNKITNTNTTPSEKLSQSMLKKLITKFYFQFGNKESRINKMNLL